MIEKYDVINNDITKIKKGERKTTNPSMKTLQKNLFRLMKKYDDEFDKEELLFETDYSEHNNLFIFQDLLWDHDNKIIRKDLSKVKFNFENIEYLSYYTSEIELNEEQQGFLGFNITKTGLAYYGLCAFNDCEMPIFFILYYDGENIRAYIPYYGNCYNPLTNTAFGYDEDYDEEYFKSIDKEFDGWEDDIYDVVTDINKILYDIENTIEIIKKEEK